MKIDIPYYIRQVLRENRKVYIPEIGTLSLVQSPASISSDKQLISPPLLSITFDEASDTDQALSQYINDTGEYSSRKVDAAIKDYTQNIFNKLINVNLALIDGVGNLVKDDEGNVTIAPLLDMFTKEYKGLTSLSIKPVERIKEDNSVNHVVETSDLSAKSNSRYSWLQPVIAGIIIAGLAILIVRACNATDYTLFQDDDNASEQIIGGDENRINDDVGSPTEATTADQEVKDELDKQYAEVDEMLGNDGVSAVQKDKLDEELDVLGTSKVAGQTKISNEKVGSKTGNMSDQINTTKQSKESTITTKSKGKYDDIIPATGECIIILGSFKKASNVTRMISKVERNGMKLFTSQYDGKTRVGFKIDCSNMAIDEYLNEVRKKYSSKAWYLDPTVYIPYQ